MFDLIIKNGKIVDGSGNPWYKAHIGVTDGKITAISRNDLGPAQKVIDAQGLVVSPGFCDLHTHSDITILNNNKALSTLHQGVTTEGVGQCGTGAYCFKENFKPFIAMDMAGFTGQNPEEIDVDWTTLAEWREKAENLGIGINLAPYIPRGTVRMSVMGVEGKGGERHEPTDEEMQAMKDIIRQGMEEGAFGISTGLRYPWERNAYTEEVIEMAKVAAEFGGIYISHMRSESDTLIESVQEVIRISEEANLPASITHHKAVFPENWGKATETMRLLNQARAKGLDVICDFYPWEHAAQGSLGGVFFPYIDMSKLPPEKMEPTWQNVKSVLEDEEMWQEIKKRCDSLTAEEVQKNEERKKALKIKGIKAPELWDPPKFNYVVYSKNHPEYIGKNLGKIAELMGFDHFLDAARALYLGDEGLTFVAGGIMSEADIITILLNPASAISTDGAAFDLQPDLSRPDFWAHPRNYGTFAKVLGRYVREMKLLSLEEGIRKMTSLPLSFLGIRDRGLIQPGMWADITIFDEESIANKATFAEPAVYPDGIHYVLVNGQTAIEDGAYTGALSGKVLHRQ
ncbi:MAG: D-aminoacylase [Anaerolineaceae bacterium]|nr:D-aminoacylase [Anaerolineaceae bacterium]